MASKSEYVNKVYADALGLGIPEPQARLAALQSGIETNYGKSAPGNAYFGVKAGKSWDGPTQTLTTHEEDGSGNRVAVKAKFRAYATPQDSLSDWWNTIQTKWPDAAAAQTFDDAMAGLNTGVHGKYATAGNYLPALRQANTAYLPPIPPADIPTGTGTAEGELGKLFGGGSDSASAYAPSFKPLPAPSYLVPPPLPRARPNLDATTFGGRLPNAAQNGMDRLVPGQRTAPPTDFTDQPVGSPDLRMLGLTMPQAPRFDPVGPGPASTGGFGQLEDMFAPPSSPPPVPMARPFAQAAPPVPLQRPLAPTQPAAVPAPQRAAIAPPAPQAQPMARLASGKMIAPGTYPSSNDGSTVTITRGPDGSAVIQHNNPGFMNIAKMGPNTVAGGYIGRQVSAAAPAIGNAFNGAKDAVVGFAADPLSKAGGALQGIQSMLFGGQPQAPQVPAPPRGPSPYPAPTFSRAVPPAPKRGNQRDPRWDGVLDRFGMII